MRHPADRGGELPLADERLVRKQGDDNQHAGLSRRSLIKSGIRVH
jgi:hypothetical protein